MLMTTALLLGGGTGYWLMRKRHSNELQASKNIISTPKFSIRQLLRDIRQATQARGRNNLQLDIDPATKARQEAQKRAANQDMWFSVGSVGLAVLGGSYPVFAVMGIAAVLYLSRDSFRLVRKDFQRGHYLSVFLVRLVLTLGMIVTGHLILAAFTALMMGFLAKIVERVEENSQYQLINLFSDRPDQVWVLQNGVEIQVSFHSLQIGDQVIVNAGEVIPVDGPVIQGEGQVDQHLLTGESQPAEKLKNDTVYASTLLLSGRLVIQVETTGETTMAAKISDVLNQTQDYTDQLINQGRLIADRFIPVKLAISAITLPILGPTSATAVIWSGFGGMMGSLGSLSVLNYMQLLSHKGVLIKDGRIFESLRKVDTVVFDKTGTLTLDEPTIKCLHVLAEYDADTVLRFAAAAEYRQPHPVAKAIVAYAQQANLDLPKIDEASYEVGYGIKVEIEGRLIQVGSARFMQQHKISFAAKVTAIQNQAESDTNSLIYIAIDSQLAGIFEMQPTIRPEAKTIIDFFKRRNIDIYIISGDHEGPTRKIAETLGVKNYFAEVLPEHKADHVEALKAKGRFVCFVGDGINDSIALKTAQVSISLKGASTAATDIAQIIFMDGTLNRLKGLFNLVDEFEDTMKQNKIISFVPGVITIGGVYFLHFGIAISMSIFYLSYFGGFANIFWPLAKHQKHLTGLPKSNQKNNPG